MTKTQPSPSLSRTVTVAEVPPAGLSVAVETTAQERAALAALNGLPAVEALRAPLLVVHEPDGGLRVSGAVKAAVTQTCVVTLDPFEAEIDEPIDVRFLPPAALDKLRAARLARGPVDDEAEEEDEPDMIEGGRIDVGALVAEHFTLGLDPWPRKPGATLAVPAADEETPPSPFAVLKPWREQS